MKGDLKRVALSLRGFRRQGEVGVLLAAPVGDGLGVEPALLADGEAGDTALVGKITDGVFGHPKYLRKLLHLHHALASLKRSSRTLYTGTLQEPITATMTPNTHWKG